MPTFKDLQDKIALDYLNRYDLIPEVKRAIAASIRCYEPQGFWFNQTATATVTVANTAYISVPSDFLQLERLELTQGGSRNKLSEADFDFVRDLNATSSTGAPTHFARRGDHFEFAVIPDSAYAVTCYYKQTLPILSADADTNAWTNEGFNLIAHDAAIDVLSNVVVVFDNRAAQITRHVEARHRALIELQSRNALRLTYRLRATQF